MNSESGKWGCIGSVLAAIIVGIAAPIIISWLSPKNVTTPTQSPTTVNRVATNSNVIEVTKIVTVEKQVQTIAEVTRIVEVQQPINAKTKIIEVAAGKPTTASSFWQHESGHSYPPTGIVDRQTQEPNGCGSGHATYWLLADKQTGWVQIDLLQNYRITKIRWLNTYNGRCGGQRATTKFHIVVSRNGDFQGEEQNIHTGSALFTTSPTYEEIAITPSIEGRHVRFYVDGYYDWGGGLNELEVYAEVE